MVGTVEQRIKSPGHLYRTFRDSSTVYNIMGNESRSPFTNWASTFTRGR